MKKNICCALLCLLLSGCDEGNSENNVQACSAGSTQCTNDGLIQTCTNGEWGTAVACETGKTCKGTTCVADEIPQKCTNNATQCTNDGLIQTCTNGEWGTAVACGENKKCEGNTCISTEILPDRTCGSTKCTGTQLCLNNVCVERNNKAVENIECNPKTFVESCDGNKLVYCYDDPQDEDPAVTHVADCSEDGSNSTCALMMDKNLGNCISQDEKCNAETTGNFTLCFDMEYTTSYMETRVCALATDGKYYPFRDDWEEIDCIGVCVDKYTCNTEKGNTYVCTEPNTQFCDGNIIVYCYEDKSSYAMNCADTGATCDATVEGGCAY